MARAGSGLSRKRSKVFESGCRRDLQAGQLGDRRADPGVGQVQRRVRGDGLGQSGTVQFGDLVGHVALDALGAVLADRAVRDDRGESVVERRGIDADLGDGAVDVLLRQDEDRAGQDDRQGHEQRRARPVGGGPSGSREVVLGACDGAARSRPDGRNSALRAGGVPKGPPP